VKDMRILQIFNLCYQKDRELNFRISSDDRFIVDDRPYADT